VAKNKASAASLIIILKLDQNQEKAA